VLIYLLMVSVQLSKPPVSQFETLTELISTTLEHHLLFINTWSLWLCVFPSGDIKVYLWMLLCGNTVPLTVTFFGAAKFTTQTPLSLLISSNTHCWLLVPHITFHYFIYSEMDGPSKKSVTSTQISYWKKGNFHFQMNIITELQQSPFLILKVTC